MPQATFIAQQIKDAAEQWGVDYEEAMACRALEDRLETGVGYFHVIRLADRHWSKQVQEGKVKFDVEQARELHSLYKWWLEPCDNILDHLDRLGRDYDVDHGEEFRECVRTARRYALIDVEATAEGLAEIAAGQVSEFDMGGGDEAGVDR